MKNYDTDKDYVCLWMAYVKLFPGKAVLLHANQKTHQNMAERTYINESHRKYEEACMREVEEMAKHPLTNEQFVAQCLRNREDAMRQLMTTRKP